MNWGKVSYVFFMLISLTTIASFLYDNNPLHLYIAMSMNLIATVLKIGVRNLLAAELMATSLVADLHLIPAFFALQIYNNLEFALSIAIGALIANIVSVILIIVEIAKTKERFE